MHPAVLFVRHVIFPSVCHSCQEDIHPASSAPLCPRCCAGLRRAPLLVVPNPLCGFQAVHLFEGAARDLVLRLKYGKKTYLARYMAASLASAAVTLREGVDLIAPVPLPPFRRIMRGFNPAERLAGNLSREWGVRMDASLLRRRPGFPSQTQLGRRERLLNANRSFVVGFSIAVKGRNVLLVDDVSTTGATLSACAHLLLKAGASSVKGLVFAWEAPESRGPS